MELKDKVAIITGASSGIGAATAKELNAAGMKLMLTGRAMDRLQGIAAQLHHAKVFAGEVTSPTLPQELLDFTLQEFGRVDVLFNNAGVMTIGKIEEVDIEEICQMVRVNVEASFRMAYTVLKHFKQTGSGYLINTSSIAGLKTGPELAAYNGTKFAIEAFSDALRVELAGTEIGVTSIAPGTVATSLYSQWEEKDKEFIFSGGALLPEDVARCVRFVLEQPSHVSVPRLLIVPKNQPV